MWRQRYFGGFFDVCYVDCCFDVLVFCSLERALDQAQLRDVVLGEISPKDAQLIAAFWPGPLTLILPRKGEALLAFFV